MAFVRIAAASEPELGSVRHHAPIFFACEHVGNIVIALLVGCEPGDVPGRERHMRGAGESDRRVVARQPLDDEHLRESVRAAAAEFFRKRDAEKAELAKLLDDVPREGFLLVPLGRMRLDFALGEVGQRFADAPLLFGQIEVHVSLSARRDILAHPLDDVFG